MGRIRWEHNTLTPVHQSLTTTFEGGAGLALSLTTVHSSLTTSFAGVQEMVTMADVYIVLFTLIGILLSLPALLVALNLLLPKVTTRAYLRLQQTPGKSFLLGIPVLSAFLLWIAITANIPLGPVKATAFLAAFVGMGVGTVGAAGLSRLLADRLDTLSAPRSRLTHLVRGAVVFELACLFPVVGWFLFAPIAGITLMGAAAFALLGWLPRPHPIVANNDQPTPAATH